MFKYLSLINYANYTSVVNQDNKKEQNKYDVSKHIKSIRKDHTTKHEYETNLSFIFFFH